MMTVNKLKANDLINVLYPVNGSRNILRRITGQVVKRGNGPNGAYITVQTESGMHRSLSAKKIVNL